MSGCQAMSQYVDSLFVRKQQTLYESKQIHIPTLYM